MQRTKGGLIKTTKLGVDTYIRVDAATGQIKGSASYDCYGLDPNTPSLGNYESMTYVLGPKTESLTIGDNLINVPVYKPVTHEKITRVYTEGSPATRRATSRGETHTLTLCGNARGHEVYTPARLEALGLCYNPETLISLCGYYPASRLHKIILSDQKLLGMDDGFNVLAFIGELRDVRKLPELLTKWKQSDKDISDKYLGYNFGVLPLFGDIASIIKRLQKLGPSIDVWNDASSKGKVFNLHRNIPYTPKGENVGSEKKPIWKNSRVVLYSTLEPGSPVQVPVYHSHETLQTIKLLDHVYFVPQNLEAHLIDDLKRSIWGLDKPLAAAWQLVPFSFVIDWFTNIGELITQFESKAPLLKVKLVSAGYSIRVTTQHTVNIGTYPGSSDLGKVVTTHSYYQRVPISVASVVYSGYYYGPLRFKQITSGQTVLGSALLHQLLR